MLRSWGHQERQLLQSLLIINGLEAHLTAAGTSIPHHAADAFMSNIRRRSMATG